MHKPNDTPHFSQTPPFGYEQIVHSLQEQKDRKKIEESNHKDWNETYEDRDKSE